MKAFDTYTHINDLKKVGFKEEQAAVIVRSLMDSRETDLANLATKDQVNNIERTMATREQLVEAIAEVRAEIKEQITELRTEINGQITGVKEQIAELRAETNRQITELRTEIKDLQINLVKWMIGLMIAFSGIIFAGIQLLKI